MGFRLSDGTRVGQRPVSPIPGEPIQRDKLPDREVGSMTPKDADPFPPEQMETMGLDGVPEEYRPKNLPVFPSSLPDLPIKTGRKPFKF